MEELTRKYQITHHKISPEKHQSNGRIERWHRELWQAIRKELEEKDDIIELHSKIDSIVARHNNSNHRGIKMSPNETWADSSNALLAMQNSKSSNYTQKNLKNYTEKNSRLEKKF